MVLVIKVWPYLKRSIFLQKESCGNNTGIQACKPIAQEVWPLWVMFENATRDSSMICRHSAPSTQFGNILKHSESRSPTWGQQTSGWRGRTIFSTSHIKKSLTQNSILRAATGWGRGESLNKRGGGRRIDLRGEEATGTVCRCPDFFGKCYPPITSPIPQGGYLHNRARI